jgi:Flp pilus assembly protein CpaB
MSSHLQKFASLLAAVAINSVFCATSFAANPLDVSTSAKSYAQATNTQTIVVKAKRLSAQQKADYDKEQMNSNMQTITISAKRLSAADKLSFDKAHKKQQHTADLNQKSMQKIA